MQDSRQIKLPTKITDMLPTETRSKMKKAYKSMRKLVLGQTPPSRTRYQTAPYSVIKNTHILQYIALSIRLFINALKRTKAEKSGTNIPKAEQKVPTFYRLQPYWSDSCA